MGVAGPAVARADESPVAAFAPPAPVRAGELATLDASTSFDPEGAPLTFRWSFGDGGLGGGVAVSHPFAVAGVYQVVLQVTDPSGATGTASASIEVGPGPPAGELAAIHIEGGALFTRRPDVSVEVRGPPGAVRAQIANAADFAGAVPVPLAPGVPWRLEDAAPDGPRQVFARFLDAGGNHLPGFDRVDGVGLDRTPPAIGRAQRDPVGAGSRLRAGRAGRRGDLPPPRSRHGARRRPR